MVSLLNPARLWRHSRWLPALFVLLSAGILGVGGFHYYRQSQSHTAQVHQELRTIEDLKAAEIVRWRAARLQDLRLETAYPARNVHLLELLGRRTEPAAVQELQEWLAPLADSYAQVLIVGADGTVLAARPPVKERHVPVTPGLLSAALAQSGPVFDQIRLGPHEEKYLDMAAPFAWPAAATDAPGAFLVLRIDPAEFLFPYIQSWPTPSPSAETLLVRREGEQLRFLNRLRHRPDSAMKFTQPVAADLPAAQAVRGYTGVVEARDYRGVPVVAAVQALPGSDWYMVAKVDAAEVHAPRRRAAVRTVAAMAGLLLLTGVLAGWWAQQREQARTVAEMALRQSAEQFRRAIHEAPVPVLMLSEQETVLQISRALTELTGYTEAEMGDFAGWADRALGAQAGNVRAQVRRLFAGAEQALELEFPITTRAGEVRRWSFSASAPGTTSDGRRYILGMAVDITERKAAEERLRESELFYRQTLESIPGMVFTTRPDGYCDYQSRQWEVYTGVPMSEHLGAGWNRLLHPEDQPRVLAAWEAAVAGRAPYNLEYRVRRHDGGYEWFRVIGQPIHDAEGNIVRWFGVATNIHESKQAEEQLREALAKAEQGEQLLTALLEYLPMGITIADAPDVTIRAVSRYGRLLTGQPREQIQNIPVDLHAQRWQVYRSDGVNLATNEELPLTRATQRGEIVLEEEFVLRRPDGVSVPILCSAAPIRDASGKITGGVIGWQDITERKRMETELRNWAATLERRVAERTAELTASNTELESFTYTVAHDLRAPVRHVLGFIEMLRRTAAGKLEPLENEHLDRIRNAAKRMEELVDGLLEFAQLGRRELVRRPVALSELVAEVRHQLEPETHGRQVEWRIAALPTVEGDERLLRQVFYNLLHNAVKFTRPRPEAVIEVGVLDPRATAEPHPPLAPDAVVLFVRDNGVGFDMRYANKLFGVFQRLHDQREFEGTGIGLAHVQRILQRHGGRVWAKSQPGSGTTIWFTLSTTGEILKS